METDMHRTCSSRNTVRRAALAAALLAVLGTSAWARDPAVHAVRLALQGPDADAAVAAGEHAVAARPKDTEAWYYAGQAYGRMAMEASLLRKPGWAIKTRDAFQAAARLDPDHLGAREGLVQFYTLAPGFMGGGKDKAAAEIASFSERSPAGGHYLRALTLEGAAAERELRAAVRVAPGESRYRRALIGLLDHTDQAAAASAVLEDGLARSPDDARLLYTLGRRAAISGDSIDAGIAALERVIAMGKSLPDDVSIGGAYWRRGQLLEKRGQSHDALADYRRSAALEPGLEAVRKDIARLTASGK